MEQISWGLVWSSLRAWCSWGEGLKLFADISSKNPSWLLQGGSQKIHRKFMVQGWKYWLRNHWEFQSDPSPLRRKRLILQQRGRGQRALVIYHRSWRNQFHSASILISPKKNKDLIFREKGLKAVDWECCWIPTASGERDGGEAKARVVKLRLRLLETPLHHAPRANQQVSRSNNSGLQKGEH